MPCIDCDIARIFFITYFMITPNTIDTAIEATTLSTKSVSCLTLKTPLLSKNGYFLYG